jgi:hypothetical protein
MSTLILEHIPVTELPAAWRAQLHASGASRVTVRIDEEAQADEPTLTQNPLFGMWHDRPDMQDVDERVRQLRQARFSHDGSRNEG